MKKIDETIENICDWINDRLNDSMTIDESYVTAGMVTVLSELVNTRLDNDLEKKVADLEWQVQSQQKILKHHIEGDNEFNDEIVKLLSKVLNT